MDKLFVTVQVGTLSQWLWFNAFLDNTTVFVHTITSGTGVRGEGQRSGVLR